ncbi:hypothetical protein MHH60_20365 [Paenibacillus sp. FSL H7-0716]|uniref:Uncharacterized protein n=1 Tax=Paenibacillus odorifer TaxID=189426 RepID=A0AB36JBL8_9BACL|nr:hypothetical protein [Paenibacillus odorifer]OME16561.1 hypothetical protein BSK47_20080 [Paenibacillus odorifer]
MQLDVLKQDKQSNTLVIKLTSDENRHVKLINFKDATRKFFTEIIDFSKFEFLTDDDWSKETIEELVDLLGDEGSTFEQNWIWVDDLTAPKE